MIDNSIKNDSSGSTIFMNNFAALNLSLFKPQMLNLETLKNCVGQLIIYRANKFKITSNMIRLSIISNFVLCGGTQCHPTLKFCYVILLCRKQVDFDGHGYRTD